MECSSGPASGSTWSQVRFAPGCHLQISLRYFLVLQLSVVIPGNTRECWNLPTHIVLDVQVKQNREFPGEIICSGNILSMKPMEKSMRIFPLFEEGFFIPHKIVWICRVSCHSLGGFCPSQRGLVKKEWISPEVWSPPTLPSSAKRVAPV